MSRRQLENFSMEKEGGISVGVDGGCGPSSLDSAALGGGYVFSEMHSETSSRDSDSSHSSREVRRRKKFVPIRNDEPEPLLQLRVRV